jgi:ketopantoate reductase
MLQDVLRNRQTEAAFFSGLIAAKGATHGIDTPFCRAATEVAHRVEAGEAASVDNLAEVFRLVGN